MSAVAALLVTRSGTVSLFRTQCIGVFVLRRVAVPITVSSRMNVHAEAVDSTTLVGQPDENGTAVSSSRLGAWPAEQPHSPGS